MILLWFLHALPVTAEHVLVEGGEPTATIVVADEPLPAMKRLGVPGLNGYGQRRDNAELFKRRMKAR